MRRISLRDLINAADEDATLEDAAAAEEGISQQIAVSTDTIAQPSFTKASIGFILDQQSDSGEESDDAAMDEDEEDTLSEREERLSGRQALTSENAIPLDTSSSTQANKKKRKARICKETGCQKYVVDHGLCIRHGGGKRCCVDDCNCRAQNRGLCWKHGGYTICKIEGCTKRAKSRGICWSHGGGTRCKTEGCEKIAVSHGKCWAHGGGKRCTVEGCKRPASERTDNFCLDHFGFRPPTPIIAQ